MCQPGCFPDTGLAEPRPACNAAATESAMDRKQAAEELTQVANHFAPLWLTEKMNAPIVMRWEISLAKDYEQASSLSVGNV